MPVHSTQLLDKKKKPNSQNDKQARRACVRYGDLVMLDTRTLSPDQLQLLNDNDLETVEQWKRYFKCERLALKSAINDDNFRSPNVKLLGCTPVDPWVVTVDNGVRYSFDVTKSMFSKGNISEKIRISRLDCTDEVVVDLFAGIGYFALVFAVHTGARQVYACEWNPVSVEALRRNATLNSVNDRLTILQGDCRTVAPHQLASRVHLGLIPSSLPYLDVACQTLNPDCKQLWLYVHDTLDYHHLTKNQEKSSIIKEALTDARQHWALTVAEKVASQLHSLYPTIQWTVEPFEIVRIKSYAPHIDHMVVDVRCTRLDKINSNS